jgi:WD40 repeat protein/serine/threonine protein kinase
MDDAIPDIRALFCEALERQSPEELTRYLDTACGDNAALRAQVEKLLASHREAGNFLGGAPAKSCETIDQPLAEKPGMVIGPYKLLQQIGEGGFGVVYMAEQLEPVRRKVALKIIKPGMDTRQIIARFEAERQALAMMDHVNIARVLDVGATESGRLYFVMELVHGVPITKYCDDNRLTPRQRLELFVPVCQAIQHAHQKGIIHRDIKPSNVMVTLYDGKPVPKVIDFGVAKATEQKLTERTLFTQYGTMVGTLEYMSPEQAEMSALGVDTRSDIFSLGVLLYELLTGSTPLSHKRMKEAALGEILRLIKEEEPPKPSTRLSESGEALASISAQRHMEPAKLSKLMRGELDWIVMKTLEKDRNRRYETASAFAADVQRYLDDETVQACPPSAGYRFRKFVRKHRLGAAVGAAVTLSLVLGLGAAVYSAVRINWARNDAVMAQQGETRAKNNALANATEATRQAGIATEKTSLAEVRLADSLVAQGNALGPTWADTKALYEEAYRKYVEHKVSPIAADLGLWSSYRYAPPALLTFASGGAVGRERHDLKLYSPGLIGHWAANAPGGDNAPSVAGHAGGVAALAISPDGHVVVSAGEDGKIILWVAPTGQILRILLGHTGPVKGVAFSPNGRLLVSAGSDGTIRMWEPQGEIRAFAGHVGGVNAVAFSRDGKRIASGGEDKTLKLWDAESATELRTFPVHEWPVTGVAFLPDSTRLLSCDGWNYAPRLWNAETGELLRVFNGHINGVGWVGVSADGLRAVTRDSGWSMNIYNLETGNRITELIGSRTTTGAGCAFVDEQGRRAISGYNDGTLKLWDVELGRGIRTYTGHRAAVSSLAVAPNGQFAVSGAADGTVMAWPLGDERVVRGLPMTDPYVPPLDALFSPDGRVVAVKRQTGPGAIGTFELWDLWMGRPLRMLKADGLSFAHGSKAIHTALLPETVAQAGFVTDEVKELMTNCVLAADGQRLLRTGGEQGVLTLRDVAAGRDLLTLRGHTASVVQMCFLPDGTQALSGDADGVLILWDLGTGRALHRFTGHQGAVHDLAVSADGQRALTGGADGMVRLWDLASGAEICMLRGHQTPVHGVAFVDGRLAVSASQGERLVKFWDLERRRELRSEAPAIAGGRIRGYRVACSPNGQFVACVGNADMLTLWDIGRPSMYRQYQARLGNAQVVVRQEPDAPAALATLGEWYALRGIHNWGAELLESARSGGADVSSLSLARCHWAAGDIAAAKRELRSALARREAPEFYLNLCLNGLRYSSSDAGLLMNYTSQWGGELQDLLNAVDERPDDLELLRQLAGFCLSNGRGEEAVAIYERAIERSPANPRLKARRDQLIAGVLAAWDFDAGDEGWAPQNCTLSASTADIAN